MVIKHKYNFTDDIIRNFRLTVIDNDDFLIDKYLKDNSKNKWSAICSCMDWISVAIRSIDVNKKFSSNIDSKVMEAYLLISCIDIISESVISLHSILYNQTKRVSPFIGYPSVFSNIEVGINDDAYFKKIRAVFGAHPTNLEGENSERLFASWPYNSSSKNFDLEVLLYSNIHGNEDKIFGLKFDELFEFLGIRYNYLNVLAPKIESISIE